MKDAQIQIRVAEALDQMQGLEAAVAYRRFLGEYSYEEISTDLHISSDDAAYIAAAGLRHIKRQVFGE